VNENGLRRCQRLP